MACCDRKTARVCARIALAALLALALAACSSVLPEDAQSLPVYATFYPIYVLADAVVADVPGIELHCLVQPQDGCLRSYALSDWDARLIASAKAVVMGGRGLESFESTLFNLGQDGPALSAALYNLELYNDSTAHTGGESASHLEGSNPHLYMSVEGAEHMIESIAASMLELDPDYGDVYAANVQKARQALEGLRADIRSIAGGLEGNPVILMNEALIYVAQDLGLNVVDRVDRESSVALYDDELDACIERLRGVDARVILIEKQAPQGFVEALEEAGFAVARVDIFSTHREGERFETYLQVQRDNAAAIRVAFDTADASMESQEEQP